MEIKQNEQEFRVKIAALMKEHDVTLKVVVNPANRFTKAVHWLVRRILRYESAVFVKSNATPESIPNV